MKQLEDQFTKSIEHFRKQAFIDVISKKPETTIKDLYMLGEKHGLSDLCIGELLGQPIRIKKKKSKKQKGAVDVRSAAARKSYDEAVLEFLKTGDGEFLSAVDVRSKIGGTPLQVRKALNRLIGNGKVTYKGKARATRYAAA